MGFFSVNDVLSQPEAVT